jgi:hypothetical protein
VRTDTKPATAAWYGQRVFACKIVERKRIVLRFRVGILKVQLVEPPRPHRVLDVKELECQISLPVPAATNGEQVLVVEPMQVARKPE